MSKYRLVVGEAGNEIGHVQATRAKTEVGAKIALGKALAKYIDGGWGRVEVQSGQDEWEWERIIEVHN